MKVTEGAGGRARAIVDLFTDTFAASEGEAEGAVIGDLARALLSDTPPEDLRVFCAGDAGALIGAAIFTRLTYPEDPRTVFLLSPMAVATRRQKQGVGQALLTQALATLRVEGVAVVMTYGDPAFYGQVGFQPVSEDAARPPLPLSQPHGWIGQSLSGKTFPPLSGPSRSVAALNRPDIW